MELGVATVLTDDGLDPFEFARTAEGLGFESLFLADHTHIPASRESPYPHPPYGDLPRQYYRIVDPLLTLSAIAAVTSTLKLGTGVCLVVERDPIILAKQVATLDHLSGGRVLFGVGAGWNREEMRNHGTDPRVRMAVLRERVEAMKAIWTQEEASYHGEHVDFDAIFSWPKPVQDPHPPVLVGGNGPTVIDRILAFGDGWMPGHQRDLAGLGARIEELQERAAAAGRGPIEVTIFGGKPERLETYAEIGASRCLFLIPSHEPEAAREKLSERARVTGLVG